MDLALMETFVAVAEAGSVATAARELHLSQSSVSRQIQRLEHQTGLELFVRRGGHALEVSDAGRRVLALGGELLSQADRIDHELRTIAGGADGHVVLGIGSMILALPEVADALRDFHLAHPAIHVDLVESHHYAETIAELARDELDAAVHTVPVDHDPELATVPIGTVTPRIVVGNDHPLADRERITIDDVATERFAFLEGSAGLEVFDALCARTGIAPTIGHRCSQVMTLATVVAAGMAITMILGTDVRQPTMFWNVPVVSIAFDAELVEPLEGALFWRRDRAPSPAARTFLEHVGATLSRNA
jgi:DNA-binding transcriptional LysR family regulator